MDKHGRYIRRLSIKAGSERSATQCVIALEDAFNTASLPGLPQNGIVFIRRLDLEHFSSSITSTALSLIIDSKIRQLSNAAVCVDEDEHPEAAIVWFHDDVQPYISMAGLITEGKVPAAWYWRHAVPDWHPAMNGERALLMLVSGAMRTSAKVSATARLLNYLLHRNRLDNLLRNATEQDAISILREAGVYPYDNREIKSVGSGASTVTQYINPAWQRELVKWIHTWGDRDVRSLWLVYNAILNHNPAAAERPSVLDTAQQIVVRLKTGKPSRLRMPDAINVNPALFKDRDLKTGEDIKTQERIEDSHREAQEYINSDNLKQKRQTYPHSRFAGMAFIVSLLETVGIRDILNDNPELAECNLPGRILRVVARRFKIPSDDPVYLFLPDIEELEESRVDRFVPPRFWENIFSNKGKKERIAHHDINDIERTVQLVMGCYLRRFADMGLRTLVRRSGRIATSKTHLDIVFELQSADVRIRKAGLDINPGWVSWLGKVVSYHYGTEEEINCG
jgi:hypothetical protein